MMRNGAGWAERAGLLSMLGGLLVLGGCTATPVDGDAEAGSDVAGGEDLEARVDDTDPQGGPFRSHVGDRLVLTQLGQADLAPEGTLRFYTRSATRVGVQIDVRNVGNLPASGSGQVQLGGYLLPVTLYQYWGGTATTPNTVKPGERGYLLADMPQSALAECSSYGLQIDVGHTLQFGSVGVFANDVATARSQCAIRWSAPVTAARLGTTPDPKLNGVSLEDFVSSRVVVRADNLKCSACHYAGSGRSYSPPVAQNQSATIDAWQTIGGLTWMGTGGWADRFLAQGPGTAGNKPAHLRGVFTKWKADGSQL